MYCRYNQDLTLDFTVDLTRFVQTLIINAEKVHSHTPTTVLQGNAYNFGCLKIYIYWNHVNIVRHKYEMLFVIIRVLTLVTIGY